MRVECLLGVFKYVEAGGEIEEKFLVQVIEKSKEENIRLADLKGIDLHQVLNGSGIAELLEKEGIKLITIPSTLFFSQTSSINIESLLPNSKSPFTILTVCEKLLL